ncbi:hypothetical protein, partial [Xanthomonas phaseoli]|uniref:hypothetical protein n=1 Tax=Xanthomonas phaseoli TaxID=1985254 RepID=UPI001EE681EE
MKGLTLALFLCAATLSGCNKEGAGDGSPLPAIKPAVLEARLLTGDATAPTIQYADKPVIFAVRTSTDGAAITGRLIELGTGIESATEATTSSVAKPATLKFMPTGGSWAPGRYVVTSTFNLTH